MVKEVNVQHVIRVIRLAIVLLKNREKNVFLYAPRIELAVSLVKSRAEREKLTRSGAPWKSAARRVCIAEN